MKNFCITFLVLSIIILTSVFCLNYSNNSNANLDYLRIHVRANSNSEIDQAVKYKVKDAVVEFITPHVKNCDSLPSAMQTVEGILTDLSLVCSNVLYENGFNYTAKASLKQELFPTRVYDNLTLESGVYNALIIELGQGLGDNWWCVIYPPLCFSAAETNVEYKSIIYDVIHKFFSR
ncbi:MAG: stage II sporulation protein R [Clostridia bacterium]|nr:stage II sporulation protein R [Clostridia bacterium]